ncbi:MAG TPA: DMT family transporter [bacterium]|nr:DMT family transporter [bacterium]
MGELFALACAVTWGFAVIFLTKSGETVSPFDLNLFRVGFTSPLLVATTLLVGQQLVPRVAVTDYLLLFASGIIGITISDTLFHFTLNRIGAGIAAIVDSLYSPFVVLSAFLMLGEKLAGRQYVGMALVVGGVLVAARHGPPKGVPRRQIALGVLCGILAMATVAFGIVLAKPVLNRSPVIWATTMRQVAALAVMLVFAGISRRRRKIFEVFRPSPRWKYSVPGTLLGSYIALILWVAGMKYTKAGAAAILNQTSTIYVLLLASVFLKEPLTRRKIVAAIFAVAGIVLITYPGA